MKRPPKVARVEFADGKAVRFRQEGANLLIEWKNRGCDWKALEPVELDPFVPEMTDTEQEAMAATGGPPEFGEAAWVESYRERFRDLPRGESYLDAQLQIRREMEQDMLYGARGGRVAPRQPNQGAVVDFATITSTNPETPLHLRAGDRIGIDIVTSEAVPEGGVFLRTGGEVFYRAADGTVTRWEDVQGGAGSH